MATLAVIGGLMGSVGKYLPTVLPLISKGADIVSNYISNKKKNIIDANNDRSKEIINFQNTILPTPDRGSGNFRYMPRFNDEENYQESKLQNYRMSRNQYESASENFEGYTNRRGDARNLLRNFDEGFRRPANQAFKRAYNVFAENSLGGGYGGNSSLTEANELAANRLSMGFEDNYRARVPRSFDMSDEYEPARKFIRRMPADRSSRYSQGSSVANLNFDTREIERLLDN